MSNCLPKENAEQTVLQIEMDIYGKNHTDGTVERNLRNESLRTKL
jgi:hypothetical protein